MVTTIMSPATSKAPSITYGDILSHISVVVPLPRRESPHASLLKADLAWLLLADTFSTDV